MSKSKYDFAAWLETKNPDEKYNFSDGCGSCLMGQYMASKGVAWDFGHYASYVYNVLDDHVDILSADPQTMGGALARVKSLEDA